MKALLYCTKGKPYITWGNNKKCYPSCACSDGIRSWHLNGKIVAEVEIDKVEEIDNGSRFNDEGRYYVTIYMSFGMLLEKSCLTDKELEKYLQEDIGYALHLTNLKVFDKPKELSDYLMTSKRDENWSGHKYTRLNKAPQNMCNVYDSQENHYVLISIQPQHLCNILNGEKTIEVRRKVLNCLKEMI